MEEEQKNTIPFFPDHVTTEAKVAGWFLVLILIIGGIGLFFPVGLGPPADPMITPEHTKPEWYFLALYQLLKYLPKTIGVVLPIIGAIGLTLLPFFDRRVETTKKQQNVRLWISIVVMVLLIALTVWGEVS
jgi:quinol-cytochrome oxidoreductase complex cytochrome b subunit